MQEQETDNTKNSVTSQDRRKAIKKIAVGVGVVTGYSVLPEKWTKPIVGQMVLPAHAETSGVPQAQAAPATTTTPAATTPDTTTPAATTPDTTTPATTTGDGTYNSSEAFTLKSYSVTGGKQFTWLANTGRHYGGPVKFVFGGGCGELHVPNATVTHGADGNPSNYNQAFYFCGTDFHPGAAEYNAGKASVFAPPGCNAGHGTLYYNK